MTLYLMRHFYVTANIPTWVTPKEFNSWIDTYDASPINPFEVTLPQKIDLFLCSPSSRTRRSMEQVTSKEVVYLDTLVEVDPKLECNISLKLPKYLWFFISRWRWHRNNLKGETRIKSEARTKALVKYLRKSNKQNIFILSHGFFFKVLEKELLAQGFKGKIDFLPKNGKIYTFMENEF